MAKLEIELKFKAPPGIAAKIAAINPTPWSGQVEQDHYFNAPDRDFARTNEAFRIRRIGDDSRLTYKGPRQPGPTKTRKEIEVPLGSGDEAFANAVALFLSLGYRSVAVVEKHREECTVKRNGFDIGICLDDVRSVGKFIEIEIVADEERKAEAEPEVLALCQELGLTTPEPRSYLRMLLESRTP